MAIAPCRGCAGPAGRLNVRVIIKIRPGIVNDRSYTSDMDHTLAALVATGVPRKHIPNPEAHRAAILQAHE